jgi:preprotein translocase subunit YajC
VGAGACAPRLGPHEPAQQLKWKETPGMGNVEILAAAAKPSSSSYLFYIIIVALFGLLYFVMIRPQRNRQRQAQQMQSQIVPGQQVRTTAGMYAKVVSIDDGDVVLEVAPGVNVRYLRRAIMDVVPGDAPTGFGAPDTAASNGEAGMFGQAKPHGPASAETGSADTGAEDGSATS